MKITGELLKAERIKKNYTVAEVANSLKLSSRIINSIESGDVNELPAKTFIRGFVKSYAQFLKLDSDLILRQFLEEMGSTQPLPKVPPPQATTSENKPQPKDRSPRAVPTNLDINQDNKKKTLLYASFAAVLLIIILIVNSIVEKYQKEAVVDKTNVAQVQPLPTVTENILAPATTPTENGAVSSPAASTVAGATASAVASIAEKPPEAVVSDITITTAAPNDFEPSAGQPVELIIEAKKEVEFFYAKGNTKNFTRVKLSPKEVQVIRSPTGLHLKAEDGSSLHLILNGIDKGQASSGGKPVRLTF